MSFIKPGVYTSYTLSQTTSTTSSIVAGIVASGSDTDVQQVTSYAQAKALFGEESSVLLAYLKAFFAHASGVVYAMGVSTDYQTAFTTMLGYPISLLCTDCADSDCIATLADTLVTNADKGDAVVAVIGCSDADAAAAVANAYNCERICLTCPAIVDSDAVDVAPAVLAGLIVDADDVTDNLNGALASTLYHADQTLDDDTLVALMAAGVCVFQPCGNLTELLRGMTTKTSDEDGNADTRFRNLSVVLIADQVVTQVRTLLEEKLLANSNSATTLDAVLSLIVCTLEDFVEADALTSYETPLVTLDEEDASICHVSLSFTVRQGIYQVYLNAMVSV